MIKAIIVLLNLACKCWVVNEARSIRLVQAGTQANQLATQLIAFFNFASVLKKVYQENIPFVKYNTYVFFIKGIIGKTNFYLHVR